MSAERFNEAEPGFVDAVARRVVELLREEGAVSRQGPRLLTVAAVAQEFGLSTDWVYANAGRLGAIRLGSGPRARLRFERATIADRIAKSRHTLLGTIRRSAPSDGAERGRGRTATSFRSSEAGHSFPAALA
jgi:hypothetical protein